MRDIGKIGLIMGGGDLPLAVIEGCVRADHDIYIMRLEDSDIDIPEGLEGETIGIAKFGTMIKRFRAKGCTHICFAGNVKRPDFKTLKPDFGGWRKLPGVIASARRGDDALMSYVLEMFEGAGFEIIAPQTLSVHILMPVGHLGAVKMAPDMRSDAEKACRIAKEMGALDIGQGAVVCNGLILAVEAAEGTDMMLERIAQLPTAIRGTGSCRRGVLAKNGKTGTRNPC